MKEYILFAGVNGAGKSTFYHVCNRAKNLERINTDEIVREFGKWNNPDDVLKAGKLAVKRISDFFENGVSFNQETTLCGKSIFRNIRKAKELGYHIELFYVGVNSADIAKKRIAHRVSKGGHGIPDKDVERRYIESLENLKRVLSQVDVALLYDNTVKFQKIAISVDGKLETTIETMPDWYKRTFE